MVLKINQYTLNYRKLHSASVYIDKFDPSPTHHHHHDDTESISRNGFLLLLASSCLFATPDNFLLLFVARCVGEQSASC